MTRVTRVDDVRRSALPESWRELPFDECVIPSGAVRLPSIPQSEYVSDGSFPVIDQGAAKFGGFTNSESAVHRSDLPLIVFGDHTRVVKFVDFPFATGADGTKLIRPNESVVDARFLYFALRSLRLPSKGYNRHFSKLREQTFAVPINLEEQRRISSVLTSLERRCEIEENRVGALLHLKAATMAKLFREGLRGEQLRDTEIGDMPAEWQVRRLGDPDFCSMSAGGTPSRGDVGCFGGSIPWVKSGELADDILSGTEEHLSDRGLEASSAKLLPAGTLLIAMYGATAGMTTILGIPACTNQAVCAALPLNDSFDPEFLRHYLVQARPRLLAARHGGAQPNLSQQILKRVLVPRPPTAEQREIGSRLAVINERIRSAIDRRDELSLLFSSTLYALMTGMVRLQVLPDA